MHLKRQMSILPRSVAYRVHSQMVSCRARLMKVGVKFASGALQLSNYGNFIHGSDRAG